MLAVRQLIMDFSGHRVVCAYYPLGCAVRTLQNASIWSVSLKKNRCLWERQHRRFQLVHWRSAAPTVTLRTDPWQSDLWRPGQYLRLDLEHRQRRSLDAGREQRVPHPHGEWANHNHRSLCWRARKV